MSEAGFGSDQEQTLLHPAEFELGEGERGGGGGPARLVLDSLSELRLLAQTPLRYRRQILALKHRFTSHRCTVLKDRRHLVLAPGRSQEGDGPPAHLPSAA